MSQLERNIKAAYENSDLFLEASEDNGNLAVDISSRARVIKLVDGEIKTNGNEIYVPGESYLISFREAEKAVKSRKKILLERINIYPLVVDYIVDELKLQEIYNERRLDMRDFKEWMEEKGKKEIDNFSQICKNRKNAEGQIDSEGLILVQELNPITPLTKGYEINDFFYVHDKIGKINLPVEIKAKEAEFSFSSDNYAKISSGNENIRKYKEGILTLEDACFFVSEVEDNIEKNFWKNSNTLSYLWSKSGDMVGNVGMVILGGLAGGLMGFLLVDVPLGERYSEMTIGFAIAPLIGAIFGGTLGYMALKKDNRDTGREATMRVKENAYELKGNSLMKVAFNGKVKDKRFENIDEFLA